MALDYFTTCRHCGSDACYELTSEDGIQWKCMDCGFYTNTKMLSNSQLVDDLIATSPDLFIDIAIEDDAGFIWFPMVINKPGVGMIFPDGNNESNWLWAYVPEVEIPEGQRERFPIKGKKEEYHTHKADYSKIKYYEKLDFILALKDAGLLNDVK